VIKRLGIEVGVDQPRVAVIKGLLAGKEYTVRVRGVNGKNL
jgi:hypothetical protein